MNMTNNEQPGLSDVNCSNVAFDVQTLGDKADLEVGLAIRIIFIILYSLICFFGTCGNILVVLAVVRNPAMRIPRNLFIVNLAISDLLLCILTAPFTVRMRMVFFWELGNVICKLVATFQGINILVSTMSITAIGLDRWVVIIFPTKIGQQRTLLILIFVGVWAISVVLMMPYVLATGTTSFLDNQIDLETARTPNSSKIFVFQKIKNDCAEELRPFDLCIEGSWNNIFVSKNAFTVACIIFQYLLPVFTLIFVYTQIAWRMRARTMGGPNRTMNQARRHSIAERQQRVNLLLIFIVVIFAVSWLPFNIYTMLLVFNVVSDHVVVFFVCHLIGMMSACANPVLYGVLNENFRVEFEVILARLHMLKVVRAVFGVFSSCCGLLCGSCQRRMVMRAEQEMSRYQDGQSMLHNASLSPVGPNKLLTVNGAALRTPVSAGAALRTPVSAASSAAECEPLTESQKNGNKKNYIYAADKTDGDDVMV